MATPRKYHEGRASTPAERMREYNKRQRQAETDRLAAEAAERQRVIGNHDRTRRALGKGLLRMQRESGWRLILGWDGIDQETADYLRRVCEALRDGSNYIP